MVGTKCPGQDTRHWKAEDIHEQECPHCKHPIEFWKTDVRVRCPQCGKKVANPRFNLGCAAWCAYAEQCLGGLSKGATPQSLRQGLDNRLNRLMLGMPVQMREIKEKMRLAEEKCRDRKLEPLPILTALVVLEAARHGRIEDKKVFIEKLIQEEQFPAEAAAEALRIIEAVDQGSGDGEAEKLLLTLVK